MPLTYKGTTLDAGYRLDLLIEDQIIIELKTHDSILPIHEAQIITYLKLSGLKLGFLMNFNVTLFKNGIRRFAV